MLLGRHMDYDENTKSLIMSLDSCDAVLVVINEVAHKVRLHFVGRDKQEIYVARNGEVIPAGIILEQKVRIGASVFEKLAYEVHVVRLTPELGGP